MLITGCTDGTSIKEVPKSDLKPKAFKKDIFARNAISSPIYRKRIGEVSLKSSIEEIKEKFCKRGWHTGYVSVNGKDYKDYAKYKTCRGDDVSVDMTGGNVVTLIAKSQRFGNVEPNWGGIKNKLITRYGAPKLTTSSSSNDYSQHFRYVCWGDCIEKGTSWTSRGSDARCSSKGVCLIATYSQYDGKHQVGLSLENLAEDYAYNNYIKKIEREIKSNISNKLEI